MKSVLLIDNYDSFTYNVYHYIVSLGFEVIVKRNDEISADEACIIGKHAIIISPGPATPSQAGICLEVIAKAATQKIPLFGICLGMQSQVQAFGGEIIVQTPPNHGKVFDMFHDNQGVMRNLPNPFPATRYHSLIANPDNFPKELTITAWCADKTIMAIKHKIYPQEGVQFHPESIRTINGLQLLQNFFDSYCVIP